MFMLIRKSIDFPQAFHDNGRYLLSGGMDHIVNLVSAYLIVQLNYMLIFLGGLSGPYPTFLTPLQVLINLSK